MLCTRARHVAIGPTLGTLCDTEADGQPNATATGDDVAGVPDDEDGVATAPLLAPGIMGTPLWGALVISLIYGFLVFRLV